MTDIELSARWIAGDVWLIDHALGARLFEAIPETEGELPLDRASLAWEICNRVRAFGPLVVNEFGQVADAVHKAVSS